MSAARFGRIGWVVAAALLIAALTGAVFLIRAGGTGAGNWPVTFDVNMSDNGTLFQFSRDVFQGKPLDWTFSPQVFVFPEIPISALAYLISGGSVQVYYLVVAMINNALLFGALFAVVRVLQRRDSFGSRMIRTLVCTTPLVLLPLIGTTTVFEYALAPTYYFGMYMAIFTGPLLFASRHLATRVVVGVALALTIASNPLTLVFVVPAMLVVALIVRAARGPRAILRPLAYAAATVAVALVVRFAFFDNLQAVSPLSYIDPVSQAVRETELVIYLRNIISAPFDLVLALIGLACAVRLFALGVSLAVAVVRKQQRQVDSAAGILMFYAFSPLTGLVTICVLLIADYLYLWPILVAPVVYALLWIPTARVKRAGAVAASAAGVALITTTIVVAPVGPARYLSYRNTDTRCVDAHVPPGMTIGYAGYFDARRIELTSDRPLSLIQIDNDAVYPYDWLTNKAYQRSRGSFFYVNAQTGQLTTEAIYVTAKIGTPDESVKCPDGSSILIYTQPAKLRKIALWYQRAGSTN